MPIVRRALPPAGLPLFISMYVIPALLVTKYDHCT